MFGLLWPGIALGEDVVVFAPASLGGTLDRVATLYEAAHGGEVRISYAGTSALAQQIRRGAPADVFLSASVEWMDVLDAEGLLVEGSRSDLLANRLVVVSIEPTPLDPTDLANGPENDRIAMALTQAVPAGQYGRQALTSLGIWDAVASRVVETDNVRAALRLAALGEVRFAVVYVTDAFAAPEVHIVAELAADLHDPILYPVAGIVDGDGAGFLDFLQSDAARALYVEDGFALAGDVP